MTLAIMFLIDFLLSPWALWVVVIGAAVGLILHGWEKASEDDKKEVKEDAKKAMKEGATKAMTFSALLVIIAIAVGPTLIVLFVIGWLVSKLIPW